MTSKAKLSRSIDPKQPGAEAQERGLSLHPARENEIRRRNDTESLAPEAMLTELCSDNGELARFLRSTHEVCEKHDDVATASLIENWIDETERRTWFLGEAVSAGR